MDASAIWHGFTAANDGGPRGYSNPMSDPRARAIVARALSLRLSRPELSPLGVLDEAMKAHDGLPLNFGTDGVPPASFAVLVAVALDRGAPVRDWAAETGSQADPAVRAALLDLWSAHVWPRFLERYRLT